MQNLLEIKIIEEAIDRVILETQASLFPLLLAKSHKTESSSFKFMTKSAQKVACDAVKDAFKETGFTLEQKIVDVTQDYSPNVLGEPSDTVGKYEEFATDLASSFGVLPMATRSNDVYDFTNFSKMILDYYNTQISNVFKKNFNARTSSIDAAIDDLRKTVLIASVFHIGHVICALFYDNPEFDGVEAPEDEKDSGKFYPERKVLIVRDSYEDKLTNIKKPDYQDYDETGEPIDEHIDQKNTIQKDPDYQEFGEFGEPDESDAEYYERYEIHKNVKTANQIRVYLDNIVSSETVSDRFDNALIVYKMLTEEYDLKFDESYLDLVKGIDPSRSFVNGKKEEIAYVSIPGNLYVYLSRGLGTLMNFIPMFAERAISDSPGLLIKFAGRAFSVFFAFLAGLDLGYTGQMAFRGNLSQIQSFLDSLCAIFLREIVGAQSEDILGRAWENLSSTGTEDDFIDFLKNITENENTKDKPEKALETFIKEIKDEVRSIANYRFENNLVDGVFSDVIGPQLQSSLDKLYGQYNTPGSEKLGNTLPIPLYFAIGAFEKFFEKMPKQTEKSGEVSKGALETERAFQNFIDKAENEIVYLDPREYKAIFQDRYENLRGDANQKINAIILDIKKLKGFNRFGDSLSLYIIKQMINTFVDAIGEEIRDFYSRSIAPKEKTKKKTRSMRDALDF